MSDEQRIKDAGAEELQRLHERYLETLERWHEAIDVLRTTPPGHPLRLNAVRYHDVAIERTAQVNTLLDVELAKLIARVIAESSTQMESSEK